METGIFREWDVDFLGIIKDVLRSKWIILLLTLSAGMLTYSLMSYSYKPQYQSEAVFAVSIQSTNSSVYSNQRSAADAASKLAQVMSSNVLRRKVAEDLGMADFSGTATAEYVEDTNLIILRVTANNPQVCYREIKSILTNHDMVSGKVLGNVVLETIRNPKVPVRPAGTPDFARKAIIVSVVTLLLLLAISIIMVASRNTVRTEYDVEKKLDVNLLATVGHESYEINPAAMRRMFVPSGDSPREDRRARRRMKKAMKDEMRTRRAKARELKKTDKKSGKSGTSILVTDPMVSFHYVETMQKLARSVISQMNRHHAKTLLVTSVMANEGKSTVAANLAITLSKAGYKVLLIDGDMRNPSLYKILRMHDSEFTDLGEILQKGSKAVSRWSQTMITQAPDSELFCILNKNTYLNSSELLTSPLFTKILSACRKSMDYIIVDSSPMAFIADVEDLISLVDASLMIIKQNVSDARDINDAIDALRGGSAKLIGCVFNDVQRSFGSGGTAYGYGYGYGSYAHVDDNETEDTEEETKTAKAGKTVNGGSYGRR